MLNTDRTNNNVNQLQLIKIDYQKLLNKNFVKLSNKIDKQSVSDIKYNKLALTYQGELIINPTEAEHEHLLGIVQPLIENTKAFSLIQADTTSNAKTILQTYINLLKHYQQEEENIDNYELSFINEKYYLFTPQAYINWIINQLPTLPYYYIGDIAYAGYNMSYFAKALFSEFDVADLLSEEGMLDRIVYIFYTLTDKELFKKTDINDLYVHLLINITNKLMSNNKNSELIELWNIFTTKLY